MALSDDQLKDLRNAVAKARGLLSGAFTAQLQSTYGIQPDGTATDLAAMPHLTDEERAVAEQLRDRIAHLAATDGDGSQKARAEATARTVREQAFTFLNRLIAVRLAEERGLIEESVRQGMQSRGFRLFEDVSAPLGGQYDRYRLYLHLLFGQLALDLPPLFDPFSPFGVLFPGEKALGELLDVVNQKELTEVWAADEAIGWAYQFFNSKDEIKEMRDKGRSGPRNSREMAVRNQFFTPHYVVQFLVDNTLGRVWVEMTKGETDLPDHLAYYSERMDERFLGDGERVERPQEGVTYVPYRKKKDPREIRLLDPACGSMHFGLYAFDVFERIYLEAWDRYPDLLQDLRDEHDRASFQKLVPRLILECNLHGVDIDPRAIQIAGLALWLRAQRTWKALGVPTEQRPRIRRSHLVVAEPMPGGEELLDELRARLERQHPTNGKLLGELVAEVWDGLKLAGEAGPLLKIEEELEGAIERAKQTAETVRQSEMFGGVAEEALPYSVEGVSRRLFYGEGPLPKVLDALHDLATGGEGEDGYRRRLFEEDAAQGLAFVELLRRRYDVVVMNPPFGDPSVGSKGYIEDAYTDAKSDVLQAFVERAGELLVPGGYLGAITNRTPLFQSTSKDWRERVVLRLFRPQLLADFGYGVLDATVEVAAYVMRSITEDEDRALTLSLIPDLVRVETTKAGKFSVPKYMEARREEPKRHQAERELRRLAAAGLITKVAGRYPQYVHRTNDVRRAGSEVVPVHPRPLLVCYRLLSRKDKGTALLKALKEGDPLSFAVDVEEFKVVPASAFVYWVSSAVRDVYNRFPAPEARGYEAKQGLATAKDPRFIRAWWEVDRRTHSHDADHPAEATSNYCLVGPQWVPIQKGGKFSPYFSEPYLVVNWGKAGSEIRNRINPSSGNPYSNIGYIEYTEAHFFYRPGITWPSRPYERGAFSVVKRGSVFSHTGMMLFPPEEEVWSACAILNSDAYVGLLHLLMPRGGVGARQTLRYEVGYIKSVPIPEHEEQREALRTLAMRGFELAQRPASARLYSHTFILPAVLQAEGRTLGDRLSAWTALLQEHDEQLKQVQSEINDIAYDLYGIAPEDRDGLLISLLGDQVALERHGESLSEESGVPTEDEGDAEDYEDGVETDGAEEEVEDAPALVHNLISYLLGVAFGRYDVRYATGDRPSSSQPDPSAPLPRMAPGMLQSADALPLDSAPSGYPIDFPRDGILVDDLIDSGPEGLTQRVQRVFEVVCKDAASALAREAAEILDVPSVEEYLRRPNGFFDAHFKQYTEPKLTSTSRRAPLYWPVTTPSGLYTLWLYYPRLSEQTLYAAVQDHVAPKLEAVEQDLARLQKRAESGRLSKEDQQRLDALATLRPELLDLRDELLRIARLPYRPSLNDGVELCAAPLAGLFGHTPWRRHLEKRWAELEGGDYDWAHLAHAIWPARVKKKAEEDKSLAIAHALDTQPVTQ